MKYSFSLVMMSFVDSLIYSLNWLLFKYLMTGITRGLGSGLLDYEDPVRD